MFPSLGLNSLPWVLHGLIILLIFAFSFLVSLCPVIFSVLWFLDCCGLCNFSSNCFYQLLSHVGIKLLSWTLAKINWFPILEGKIAILDNEHTLPTQIWHFNFFKNFFLIETRLLSQRLLWQWLQSKCTYWLVFFTKPIICFEDQFIKMCSASTVQNLWRLLRL